MPVIKLETVINAPVEICFDLSRSIDLHIISTAKTNEIAIAGITKGLIGQDECVTWQAKHFGIRQKLTTKITAYDSPSHFRDEQIKGIFKLLKHDHYFDAKDNRTIMTDVFFYESPFGILGRFFNKIILNQYLKKLLWERNELIKEVAETGEWKQFLL